MYRSDLKTCRGVDTNEKVRGLDKVACKLREHFRDMLTSLGPAH